MSTVDPRSNGVSVNFVPGASDPSRPSSCGRVGKHIFTTVKNFFARALYCFCPCFGRKSKHHDIKRGEPNNIRRTAVIQQKGVLSTFEQAVSGKTSLLEPSASSATLVAETSQKGLGFLALQKRGNAAIQVQRIFPYFDKQHWKKIEKFNNKNADWSKLKDTLSKLGPDIKGYLNLTEDSITGLYLQTTSQFVKQLHDFCCDIMVKDLFLKNGAALLHQAIYSGDGASYLNQVKSEILSGESIFFVASAGQSVSYSVETKEKIAVDAKRFANMGERDFSAFDVIIKLLQEDVALQSKICFTLQIATAGVIMTFNVGDKKMPFAGCIFVQDNHYSVAIDNQRYDCPDDEDCALHALNLLRHTTAYQPFNSQRQRRDQAPGGYDIVVRRYSVRGDGVMKLKLKLPDNEKAHDAIRKDILALRNRGKEVVLAKVEAAELGVFFVDRFR
jgi:hypothetical protein